MNLKKMGRGSVVALVVAASVSLPLALKARDRRNSEHDKSRPHNVILFVADGLRHDSVNIVDAPTIYRLRKEGVDFANSHSLFPTVTTANASALATGHGLGDTGNFTNELFVQKNTRDAADSKNCNQDPRKLIFDMEDNFDLALLNCLHGGNYMGIADTLISLARNKNYNTAVIGKGGPTAIQDISEVALAPRDHPSLKEPRTAIIDGATGTGAEIDPGADDEIGNAEGFPIPAWVLERMLKRDLRLTAPKGTEDGKTANVDQQKYFTDVVVKAILPRFSEDWVKRKKPFLLIFWSPDPDHTQHSQQDSLDKLDPGINGPTSKAAIHNADHNLSQILDALKANGLQENTDLIVTADHGFSTVSRGALDPGGISRVRSYSTAAAKGVLPPAFLALDLAHALQKDDQLYDLDSDQVYPHSTVTYYPRVDRDKASTAIYAGSALIGGTGKATHIGETDAGIITVPSGNSELIYLPQVDPTQDHKSNPLVAHICDFLTQQDYVDGVFVRDNLGEYPGTLPLSSIGLYRGSAKLTVPAIVVNFKGFPLNPKKPWYTWVQITDGLQQGQGMHGGLNRADTFNNIIAAGPDFRKESMDSLPVSNADVAQTIAHILQLDFTKLNPVSNSPKQRDPKWQGRILYEALKSQVDYPVDHSWEVMSSRPTDKGLRTVLHFQRLVERNDKEKHSYVYYDQACLVVAIDSADARCKYSDRIGRSNARTDEITKQE
jgi:arylsulfatase A-like enzyme